MDKLGMTATDTVTGIKGTVTAVQHYLHNATQYLLEWGHQEGSSKESKARWVEVGRLQFTE